MLGEGRRQHERRSARQLLYELEAGLSSGELNVDEDHVHRQRRERFARLGDARHRAYHFGELRRLDQLHQVVPRRPFVFEHERAQTRHDWGSSNSSVERLFLMSSL